MTNYTLWALLALILIAVLFWQHRKQAEYARQLIGQRCRHLNIQLLSVGYIGFSISAKGVQWRYQFEFASVADSHYTGNLFLQGRQYRFDIPAYRENQPE